MDGIVYLLNQAGIALAQAEAQIQQLTKELEEARKASNG